MTAMARYETGTRRYVIYQAIHCAIQDRVGLIDCHLGLVELTKEDREVVADCEKEIRDFEKLGKSLLGQETEFYAS